VTETATAREQLGSEIAHWRGAADALSDLDTLASAGAWAGLEDYLRTGLRARLLSAVRGLGLEAAALETTFRAGASLEQVRSRLLRLRARYLQLETVLDFFGDALASRANPHTAAILRGLDTLASTAWRSSVPGHRLRRRSCTRQGLGASILRAGVRL
jgi:hypothetical protein